MKKTDTTKKKKHFDFISLTLVITIIMVAALSVNCYIRKYESDYQGTKLQEELSKVKNEEELLKIEYQKKANYKQIHDYVKENYSMKKVSNYQIEYFENTSENTMQVVKNEKSSENIFSRVSKAFSVLLEYFN